MNEYQKRAAVFAVYPEDKALEYLALGLTSEAGEVAGKVKKKLRGDKSVSQSGEDLASEIGDCLWYVSELARSLGYTLEEIAQMNIKKLSSRAERGKLKGSGDNR